MNDFKSALQSKERALEIRRELFGEKHSLTGDNYGSLAVAQHEMKDFKSALQSDQHALEIRRELYGKKHSLTGDGSRESSSLDSRSSSSWSWKIDNIDLTHQTN